MLWKSDDFTYYFSESHEFVHFLKFHKSLPHLLDVDDKPAGQLHGSNGCLFLILSPPLHVESKKLC